LYFLFGRFCLKSFDLFLWYSVGKAPFWLGSVGESLFVTRRAFPFCVVHDVSIGFYFFVQFISSLYEIISACLSFTRVSGPTCWVCKIF
jgi:hypothetical protein